MKQTAVLKIEGSSFKDVVSSLEPLGMYRVAVNKPVTQSQMDMIENSLSSEMRGKVQSQEYEVIPRSTLDFTDGKNNMSAIDFDVVQNTRLQQEDPILIFTGPDAKRLAIAAKEILEEPVTIDILKNGLMYGVESEEFLTSVKDLARLKGVSAKKLYEDCVNRIVSGSVTTMKNPVLTKLRTKPERRQKIKLEV